MRLRLPAALAALTVLMAFAPAPFPRPGRDLTRIDLDRFQGTWKVADHHLWQAGTKQRSKWTVTHIRVAGHRWTLMNAGGEIVTYRIEIDPAKKPALIDWRGERGEALWLGLIRRDGDKVEVIYYSATQRPANFDTPPSGSYLITLQRSR
jgi:uncharacterized protein (TIGR03067 family)